MRYKKIYNHLCLLRNSTRDAVLAEYYKNFKENYYKQLKAWIDYKKNVNNPTKDAKITVKELKLGIVSTILRKFSKKKLLSDIKVDIPKKPKYDHKPDKEELKNMILKTMNN